MRPRELYRLSLSREAGVVWESKLCWLLVHLHLENLLSRSLEGHLHPFYPAIRSYLQSRIAMENCDEQSNTKREKSLPKTGIHSLPNELFEMIIGSIAFVDLPYFLQSSNSFNVPAISFYFFSPNIQTTISTISES